MAIPLPMTIGDRYRAVGQIYCGQVGASSVGSIDVRAITTNSVYISWTNDTLLGLEVEIHIIAEWNLT